MRDGDFLFNFYVEVHENHCSGATLKNESGLI